MLKKTFNFTDYNGVERTETHYFNLTRAEISELNFSEIGGLEAYLKRIIAADNLPELIKIFKKLICMSYGVISPDGRRFIKNDEVLKNFTETEAFSQLYMELSTDAKAASKFVNGIIPDDMKVDDAAIEAAREELEGPVVPVA